MRGLEAGNDFFPTTKASGDKNPTRDSGNGMTCKMRKIKRIKKTKLTPVFGSLNWYAPVLVSFLMPFNANKRVPINTPRDMIV